MDNRFPSPGTDTRFTSPGADTRFDTLGVDGRFLSPGADTRFGIGIGAYIFDGTSPTMVFDPSVDLYYDNTQIKKFSQQNNSTALGARTVTLSNGLLGWAGHNIVLNSSTLVTQDVTTAAADYTIAFTGTGTVNLTGASTAGPIVGTGVNTLVSLEVTTTAGTLTLTVTGSVTLARVYRSDLAGMQINDTSDPTYYPTTGLAYYAPAFDYDPVAIGTNRQMRIEPAATNLQVFSNDFANATWTKSTSSITSNTTVSPDGTVNADKLVEDTSTGVHQVSDLVTVVSGASYTGSVFIKAAERTFTHIYIQGVSNSGIYANLSTGVITSEQSAVVSSSIEAFGAGWFRIKLTVVTTTTSASVAIVTSTGDGVASFTGDGVSGVYIYEAQLEAGTVATSTIPTVASTAPRLIDNLSMGPVPNGVELVPNGTFDTDASGWTALRSSVLSVVSGRIRVTNGGGVASGTGEESIPTIVGVTYKVSTDVKYGGAVNADYRLGTTSGGLEYFRSANMTSDQTVTTEFTATSTTLFINLFNQGGVDGDYNDWDNVTVQEVIPFVGYNQAQVSGKLTVTPLADGAVRYVNFNNTTANEVIEIGQDASNNVILTVTDGGVVQASIDSGVNAVIGTELIIGYRAGANDFAISVNGAAAVVDTSGTMPTVAEHQIGEHCLVKLDVAYDALLTNAQLVELST